MVLDAPCERHIFVVHGSFAEAASRLPCVFQCLRKGAARAALAVKIHGGFMVTQWDSYIEHVYLMVTGVL